jgi:heat shock protein HslJ
LLKSNSIAQCHGTDIVTTSQNNRSMKKLLTALPLAILLAYCSGPNNTQTTTDTDIDATASTTTTTTVSDEVATTTTVNHSDRTIGDVTVDHSTSVLVDPIPDDPNDPMYQHWQRTNAQYWTYDYDYPGYVRPTGAYNSAISGNWTLNMTPSLATAWRTDGSNGDTYLSASESFNTTTGASTTEDATVTTVVDVNSINYRAYNGNMYQMPTLNIYLDNGSFTGYTGCNAISGRLEVSGNNIRFLNLAPSTAIECMGGFDQSALLDLLRRVDSYAYVGEELQLMQGNEVLLTLKK